MLEGPACLRFYNILHGNYKSPEPHINLDDLLSASLPALDRAPPH